VRRLRLRPLRCQYPISESNTVCVGFGPAAGVSLPDVPVTVNGGPLVYGDLNNAKGVLSGFSISYGLQPARELGGSTPSIIPGGY